MAAILILDPSEDLRRSYRGLLERRGFAVFTESLTTDSLKQLREGGIDAVLLDHTVEGGIDALVEGLHRLPDPPPMILHSADVGAPGISARLGAAAFLPKPCTDEELLAVVERVVAASSVPETIEDSPTYPVERTTPSRPPSVDDEG